MIVCVSLVSNSRGCCLAAGRSLGLRLRDRPVRRDNTLGSLTPTIHTQSCLIPIITRCHHFIHTNQYSGHIKKFKVWIESNRSLRCHVTTLSWRQVSQSPPPPVTKMRVPGLLFFCWFFCLFVCFFCLFFLGGRLETGRVKSNCARQESSDTCGDNEVDDAVCLQAEFHMHAVLSHENDKFYTTMIYPCFSRSVCFSMGSPAWWRFGLCSSGSSLVSRWRSAPLVHARISNVTSQM